MYTLTTFKVGQIIGQGVTIAVDIYFISIVTEYMEELEVAMEEEFARSSPEPSPDNLDEDIV